MTLLMRRKLCGNNMCSKVWRPGSDVALTTDSWTSITMTNYIAVTAHYITEQFELGSCLLECFQFTERHTAENVKSELMRVVKDWNIEGKVVDAVTDNAANIVAAVKQTGFKHVPCFARTLNLVVQDALQSLAAVLL